MSLLSFLSSVRFPLFLPFFLLTPSARSFLLSFSLFSRFFTSFYLPSRFRFSLSLLHSLPSFTSTLCFLLFFFFIVILSFSSSFSLPFHRFHSPITSRVVIRFHWLLLFFILPRLIGSFQCLYRNLIFSINGRHQYAHKSSKSRIILILQFLGDFRLKDNGAISFFFFLSFLNSVSVFPKMWVCT